MSDLISRQDAIDEVEGTDWYHQNKKGEMVHGANPSDHQAWYKAEDIYNVLESLLSAEPKTPSNGSITSVKPENMHDRTTYDLIRRQDAKDAIDMALDHIDHVPPWVYDKLLNALNEVPSAEKAQLSGEDATSVCKCPCEYREPCDVCHYDGHLGLGCPAEEGVEEDDI